MRGRLASCRRRAAHSALEKQESDFAHKVHACIEFRKSVHAPICVSAIACRRATIAALPRGHPHLLHHGLSRGAAWQPPSVFSMTPTPSSVLVSTKRVLSNSKNIV